MLRAEKDCVDKQDFLKKYGTQFLQFVCTQVRDFI